MIIGLFWKPPYSGPPHWPFVGPLHCSEARPEHSSEGSPPLFCFGQCADDALEAGKEFALHLKEASGQTSMWDAKEETEAEAPCCIEGGHRTDGRASVCPPEPQV